jgi:sensor c-di-GMP phosphodiesterase-like protein
MVEWLLQKAIQTPPKSYSPQDVAIMLDNHTKAIKLLLRADVLMFIAIGIVFGYSIVLTLIMNKRLKKLEK